MDQRTRIVVNVDPEVKRRLKHMAIDDETTLSDLVAGFIEAGMAKKRRVKAPPRPPTPIQKRNQNGGL